MKAVVSGSFDPVTNGHMYVINKALSMFDSVDIVVASNPDKKYMFTEEERIDMVREALPKGFGRYMRACVLPPGQLLVELMKSIESSIIVRGLRNNMDYEYELQLDLVQKKIAPDIETVFVFCPRELTEVSSSLIRAAVKLDSMESIIRDYVPENVLTQMIKYKFDKRNGVR